MHGHYGKHIMNVFICIAHPFFDSKVSYSDISYKTLA